MGTDPRTIAPRNGSEHQGLSDDLGAEAAHDARLDWFESRLRVAVGQVAEALTDEQRRICAEPDPVFGSDRPPCTELCPCS